MVAGGRIEGWDNQGVWMDMYTLLYLKWTTNNDLLHSTGSSAQCHTAAWMGGEFGGERIHVYIWLRPFPVHLRLPQPW